MLFFLCTSYALSSQRTGDGAGYTTPWQTREEARSERRNSLIRRNARRERRRSWVQRQVAEQDMRYARSRRASGFALIAFVLFVSNNIIRTASNPISRIISILTLFIVGGGLAYNRYRVDNLIRNNQRSRDELLTEATQIDPSSEEEE